MFLVTEVSTKGGFKQSEAYLHWNELDKPDNYSSKIFAN